MGRVAHLETGILIVVIVVLVANLVAICSTRSRT
jgi:predicted small secreted protein